MNKEIKFCIVSTRQIDRFGAHILQHNLKEVWFEDGKPIAIGYEDLRETAPVSNLQTFDNNPNIEIIKELFNHNIKRRIGKLTRLDVDKMPRLVFPDDFPESDRLEHIPTHTIWDREET